MGNAQASSHMSAVVSPAIFVVCTHVLPIDFQNYRLESDVLMPVAARTAGAARTAVANVLVTAVASANLSLRTSSGPVNMIVALNPLLSLPTSSSVLVFARPFTRRRWA